MPQLVAQPSAARLLPVARQPSVRQLPGLRPASWRPRMVREQAPERSSRPLALASPPERVPALLSERSRLPPLSSRRA